SPGVARAGGSGGWEIGLPRERRRSGGHIREDDFGDPRGLERPGGEARPDRGERFPRQAAAEKPVVIYPFGISQARLDSAIRSGGVNVTVTADVRGADAVITLRTYQRRKPPALREAEERSLPVYVIKSNTESQIEKVLLQ